MPEENGFEFRKEQLSNPELNGIPVVVMSAFDHFEKKLNEISTHVHLRKPVHAETVIEIANHLCNPKPREDVVQMDSQSLYD